MNTTLLRAAALGALALASLAPVGAGAQTIKPNFADKGYYGPTIRPDWDLSLDTNGESTPVSSSSSPFVIGFEGISQYDGASFGRNFVPPDTNGAVGGTQYMEVSNGAYAVFDKYTGARTSLKSDVSFWQGVGQTGTNGDTRVMYNAAAKRWIVIAFGSSVSNINVAVSDTDNALGSWKSTSFTGFSGGTADYPTLALDGNAVYIGTNNFNSAGSFRGTTLNVIPIASLFSAAPTTTGMKQFVTPYSPTTGGADGGFAIQGVNSDATGTSGKVIATSLFFWDALTRDVNGLTPTSATSSTVSAVNYVGPSNFVDAGPARQPNVVPDTDVNLTDAITSNSRVADSLDSRISSSAYQVNGRVYTLWTDRDPTGPDFARVHYLVLDATTNAILDEGYIGQTGYDYFQGSIAVNRLGQVVIGYNRSGSSAADGKIRFYAQTFNTDASGKLVATNGGPIMLKESLVDDYHNGSVSGQVAVGRQRWGDYSQVSVDPTSSHGFYLIGEFAREYNNGALHPGGTGGSRWGTFIAGLDVGGVPEPASWAMMITGFGLIGASMRRQRRMQTVRA